MLSYDKPTLRQIKENRVPTAQSIWDALSVSEYMDHVVDAWIAAYMRYKAEKAVSQYQNRNLPSLAQIDTDALQRAEQYFTECHHEMVTRWGEYADSDQMQEQ